MAERNRVMLQMFVDLDNVPGEFHTETSAANVVENILKRSIPHYNPVVHISKETKTCSEPSLQCLP